MYWVMSSLAAKGLSMEPRVGTDNYIVVLVITALLSGSIYTLLCWTGLPSVLGKFASRLPLRVIYDPF